MCGQVCASLASCAEQRTHAWLPTARSVLGPAAVPGPVGGREIPARLALLTSVEAGSCLPDPHSCAIHLQHTPPASCSPACALQLREAARQGHQRQHPLCLPQAGRAKWVAKALRLQGEGAQWPTGTRQGVQLCVGELQTCSLCTKHPWPQCHLLQGRCHCFAPEAWCR